MVCRNCGSDKVNIQAVARVNTHGRGCAYWLFIGWWLEFLLWIFMFPLMLLLKLFGSKGKIKTKVNSHIVCQSCGFQEKI